MHRKYHNVVWSNPFGYWEYKNGSLIPFDITSMPKLFLKDEDVGIRMCTEDEQKEIIQYLTSGD